MTKKQFYLQYLKKNPTAVIGLSIILLYVLMIILAPVIAPYDPYTPTDEFRSAPNAKHLFGTDPSGLDVFSRVLYASRIDLFVGISGTIISILLGTTLGLITGYFQGWYTTLILRIADLLQAFPTFVLAMALVAIAGPNISNVIIVIGLLNIPVYLRLVRSDVLTFKARTVTDAAICAGNDSKRILLKYMFTNNIESALVQASVNVGWAILLTASLSFIGAGIPVPTPEWGSMVSIGASMMITGEWWASFFPGVAIGLCVLGFSLVGDSIRVLVNPEKRG